MTKPKLPITSRVLQMLLLAGFFFIGFLVASVVSLLLNGGATDDVIITRWGVLASSVVQNIAAFIAPVVLLAWLVSAKPWKELYITTLPRWTAVAGVVLISIVSIPAMNWLTAVNEAVTFPEWLSPLEELFRSMENQAAESTKVIMDVTSVSGLIINILIVGVLTGIGEEMFFRGGVQSIMHRGSRTVKPWMAIWVTAFIFSALHFQFFGFLPRMLLGAYFGYLLVWTRSLWVPVIAHALNNSMALWSGYAVSVGQFTEDSFYIGAPGSGMEWTVIVSVILLVIIFVAGRKRLFYPRITAKCS